MILYTTLHMYVCIHTQCIENLVGYYIYVSLGRGSHSFELRMDFFDLTYTPLVCREGNAYIEVAVGAGGAFSSGKRSDRGSFREFGRHVVDQSVFCFSFFFSSSTYVFLLFSIFRGS